MIKYRTLPWWTASVETSTKSPSLTMVTLTMLLARIKQPPSFTPVAAYLKVLVVVGKFEGVNLEIFALVLF